MRKGFKQTPFIFLRSITFQLGVLIQGTQFSPNLQKVVRRNSVWHRKVSLLGSCSLKCGLQEKLLVNNFVHWNVLKQSEDKHLFVRLIFFILFNFTVPRNHQHSIFHYGQPKNPFVPKNFHFLTKRHEMELKQFLKIYFNVLEC